MRRDHLIDVATGRAEKEDRRADDSGSPQANIAAKGEEPDNRKAETGETDFGLKWTVGPADEPRGYLAEEHVHHEVVEIADADREQQEIREQRFDQLSARTRRWLCAIRDRRGDQADDEEGEGEIREGKPDRCFDHEQWVPQM